jgi:hypothetical protein
MRKTQILLSLLLFLLMTTFAWGVSSYTGKWQSGNTALIFDTDVTIDANALEMFIYNDGNFAYDNANVFGKTDGLYFPRGTKKTVIYAGGIWLGGKVDGGIRVAIAEFSSEFVPGNMENGTFVPDNASFKVFKIKRGDDAASNPDYANWPADMGAPVNDDGTPAMLGDVMTWSVYNEADVSKHTNMATDPLGLEVQHTAFAYARGGALGQVIFQKFKIINNGTNTIDSTYVSLWADPDLGDASDDLVGCDTVLSLGYCYNEGADGIYGAAPPAVGYDFFQGPIVPGEATDSAYVSGEYISGFKNLPMTSFNKYINGTDPAEAEHVWRYMKGLQRDVDSLPVDNNGDTTRFVHAGDPVTGTGWIDQASADRRWMMSSGPFTMEPGDVQEVVTAVLVGQGTNPLNSIDALKTVDVAAQGVFDLNFDIPSPPPPPTVWARGGNGFIDLTWGDEPVGDVQPNEKLNQEFHFEGFNVFQGESSVGPWHKFATYDIENAHVLCGTDSTYDDTDSTWSFDTLYCSVTRIYADVVSADIGEAERVQLQEGTDAGLQFNIAVDRDQITGSPLVPNRPYYFAVSAYSYDYNNVVAYSTTDGRFVGYITEVLESPLITVTVRPQTQPGYFTQMADHTSGSSDGLIYVEYLTPEDITGDSYKVEFNDDLSWDMVNLTTGEVLYDDEVKQDDDFNWDVFDGIMPRVVGLPPGIKDWDWEGSSRWVSGVNWGAPFFFGGLSNGNDFFGSNLTQAGTPDAFKTVEIRFSYTETQMCANYLRGGSPSYGYQGFFECPFTVWDVSSDPPVQLNACFVENVGSGAVDQTWLPVDGGREYLFIMASEYTGSVNPAYTAETIWDVIGPGEGAGDFDCMYAIWPTVRGAHVPADELEDGQKFIILAAKPNLPGETFTWTSQKVGDAAGEVVANTLDSIKTVPNPYYAFYPEEIDQFDRIVKFINLPANPLTIKIFNIAGDLIRTMERTEEDIYDPEFVWDLKTDSGLWVASGIYVWLIEAEGLGSRYGKMAIFTEVEQLNTF